VPAVDRVGIELQADAATFAGKGNQVVVAALGAAGAGETAGENAAFELAAELPLDRSRGRFPGRRVSVVQQELQDDAGGNRN